MLYEMIQESIQDTECLDYFETEQSIVIVHNIKSSHNCILSEYPKYDTPYEEFYDYTLYTYNELEKIGLLKVYEIGENTITLQLPHCKPILSELLVMSQKTFIDKMVKLLTYLWSNGISFDEFSITHIGVKEDGEFTFINPKFLDYDPVRHRFEYLRDLRLLSKDLDEIYDIIQAIMIRDVSDL
jgi:hypothetical protein